jgi:pyroglutamyl-peptidase
MILATAFNAFGSAETNASEILLNALEENKGVFRVVLPTEYRAAGTQIVRLIRDVRPEAVVCFGVANGPPTMRLEQLARNWDATDDPDNAGDLRIGQAIIPEAPNTYRATLPYEAMRIALDARKIPHVDSDDAGGYVCNHTFFRARHEIAESGIGASCGFIHVPPINSPQEFVMFLEAIRICIQLAASAV